MNAHLRLAMLLAALAGMLFIHGSAKSDPEGSVVPGTVAPRSSLGGCLFNTAPPTAINNQQASVQCDATGNQRVILNSVYPAIATPVTNSSGNVAAANAVATLAGVAGKTTFLCGFTMTSAGSTGAAVVSPTVAGTISGTLTYTYTSIAGATLANPTLHNAFNPCLPASAVNTAIVVTLPSLGAGNTNATTVAWGFQQ